MAATWHTADQKTSASTGGTITVDKPDNVTEDDLLVAVLNSNAPGSSSPTWSTPPTGWTLVRDETEWGSFRAAVVVYYKVAGASEPVDYTWSDGPSTDHKAVVGRVTGFDPAGPVGADSGATASSSVSSLELPSIAAVGGLLVGAWAWRESGKTLTLPGSMTSTVVLYGDTDAPDAVVGVESVPDGSTGTRTTSSSASEIASGVLFEIVDSPNNPPDAPNLTNPVNGATIDRTSTERFTWDFSDPDDGDSQSKFDLQIREQGETLLDVDVTQETTNEYYDLPGGTLTAGNYEWRARTYDALGEQGPWSGWEPFVAADPPAGPTITDPTSGSTISTETYTVQWSASEQDEYQLRRVADDAGSPDTTTVYFDTGTVESSSARSRSVEFPVNDRFEHIQLRVRRDGLWSVWASNRVEVSYTPPAEPSLTVSVHQVSGRDAALDVDITNPSPGTGEPSVTSNEVHRRKVGDTDGIRVAVGVASSGTFRDWAVASGQPYEYRVKAIGDNGTSSWSGWVA